MSRFLAVRPQRCRNCPYPGRLLPHLNPSQRDPVSRVRLSLRVCSECAWSLLYGDPELRARFGNPFNFEPQEPR